MARPPISRVNMLAIAKRLRNNDRFIQTVAVAKKKPGGIGRNIKKISVRLKARKEDKKAQARFNTTRGRGLNLDQLLASVPRNIVENAVRDKVTITDLKLSKDKQMILSKSLTYDKTSGREKIRLHKHTVKKLYTEGEHINEKFSKAKRLSILCDCEWFMYHCEYALATKWGASSIMFSNGEFPIQTNPTLKAQACKHMHVLLRYIRQNKI